MGKIIAVVSGKGGTGKTTTVGALASCLAALGHRTLCIDCDVGLRNLDITLGMSDFSVMDFSDVLNGYLTLDEACSEHPVIKGLFFLAAPAGGSLSNADGGICPLLDEVRENFDYCFIDAPAGVGAGFRFAAEGADMAIIVTTGDISSMRDGQRVAEELDKLGVPDMRLIVNRVARRNFRRTGMTVDGIIDVVGAKLIGLIYEDDAVGLAANREKALVLYNNKRAALQFLRTAQRIRGEEIPISIR